MIAEGFDSKIEQISRLLILSYSDLMAIDTQSDEEKEARAHLLSLAPEISDIKRQRQADINEPTVKPVFENEVMQAVVKDINPVASDKWLLRLEVRSKVSEGALLATVNASNLLKQSEILAQSSPFAIRILTDQNQRVYGQNENLLEP